LLSDFSSSDRILLSPGVTFLIGEKTVECAKIEAPAAANESNAKRDEWEVLAEEGTGESESAGAFEMPRLVICPACFKDMTSVPVAARFCPKCGVQLPARNAAGFLIPPEESSPLYPVYRSLRDELEKKLQDESPQIASSMIILAYANAMLNLGWKYEHGRGILRNVEEAARCYAKAGKLSQAWGSSG
jgi:TPR repeat protein